MYEGETKVCYGSRASLRIRAVQINNLRTMILIRRNERIKELVGHK